MKAISLLFLLIACSSHRYPTTEDPIQAPLLSKYPDYLNCYEKSDTYKAQPLSERHTMNLEVFTNPDGSVKEAKILKSTIQEKALTECVLSHINILKFPESKMGYSIKQPINFYQRKP